jgi:hypothetical protein
MPAPIPIHAAVLRGAAGRLFEKHSTAMGKALLLLLSCGLPIVIMKASGDDLGTALVCFIGLGVCASFVLLLLIGGAWTMLARRLGIKPSRSLALLTEDARVKALRELPLAEWPSDVEVGGECALCLEAYVGGDRVRSLPCAHSFHMVCVDRWFASGAPTHRLVRTPASALARKARLRATNPLGSMRACSSPLGSMCACSALRRCDGAPATSLSNVQSRPPRPSDHGQRQRCQPGGRRWSAHGSGRAGGLRGGSQPQ